VFLFSLHFASELLFCAPKRKKKWIYGDNNFFTTLLRCEINGGRIRCNLEMICRVIWWKIKIFAPKKFLTFFLFQNFFLFKIFNLFFSLQNIQKFFSTFRIFHCRISYQNKVIFRELQQTFFCSFGFCINFTAIIFQLFNKRL
jgi:hypothetical protein